MAGTPASSVRGGLPLGLAGAVSPTRYVGGTADVAPVSGMFAAGDFVVSLTGKVWVCTVAGSPGTWTQISGGGGAGGLVLLEQHAAAASATLDFTTFISATYDEYLIELLSIVPVTTNTNLYMRMGTGGGPSYDGGANYGQGSFRFTSSGSTLAGADSGQVAITLDANGGIKNDASLPFNGSFRLFDPQSSSHHKFVVGQSGYVNNAGVIIGTTTTGIYLVTTTLTALRFMMSAGNIASGTIRIYGVAKT